MKEDKKILQDIGCCHCGTKLGHVELKEGEIYKGDFHYQFICDSCKEIINQSLKFKKLKI